MPSITVRPYEDRDRDGFFHVRSVTYEDAKPIPEEKKVLKNVSGYLAEVDGEIGGVYSVLDLTATRGPALLRCAGIAAVAVLPEYRRSGVGAAMMRWGLRNLREQGFDLASLYAFRESFYRRFGYEVCGTRWKVEVPSHRFPRVEGGLAIRRLPSSEVDQIKPAYEMFSHARSGMNIRTPAHWERVLGSTDEALIYAAGAPVEAYAIVRHKWEFWEGQHISEVAWITERGYDSILGLLAGIGINKSSVTWYEPSDSPFLSRYMDQSVKLSLDRPIMFRALNVPSCLRKLRPAGSGEFSLRVLDSEVPENEGPWRVRFRPDCVDVEACSDADLSLSVSSFTQALLGQPCLEDLVRNGSVSFSRAEAFDAARCLLPGSPVFCSEFF
jgi:predicted acetyltransferase